MYPPEFDYVRAASVAEALSLLDQHPGAKLLAGGHSLIPLLKLRQSRPKVLIDIGRIPDLKGIRRAGDSIVIGALTTHALIASSSEVPAALAEAAGIIADLQVRNRGTIGGNIAHADPGSDLPTVLTALDAVFHVQGSGGERRISSVDFFTGLLETALRENEVLTSVEMPLTGNRTGSAYQKMVNPASGYAMLGAAAVVTFENGRCSEASIAIGGLTPHAMRAPSVEAALVGRQLDSAAIALAAAAVVNDLGGELLGDIHASAAYRKSMAPRFVAQAVEKAAARARA
jgi:carbon-monoxide dehydrogenase medium subunit